MAPLMFLEVSTQWVLNTITKMEHIYALATADTLWSQSFSHRATPAEMIDRLSWYNGVAISGCRQSATGAISEVFRSIRLSVCFISRGRTPSNTHWVLQECVFLHILKSNPPASNFHWCIYSVFKEQDGGACECSCSRISSYTSSGVAL